MLRSQRRYHPLLYRHRYFQNVQNRLNGRHQNYPKKRLSKTVRRLLHFLYPNSIQTCNLEFLYIRNYYIHKRKSDQATVVETPSTLVVSTCFPTKKRNMRHRFFLKIKIQRHSSQLLFLLWNLVLRLQSHQRRFLGILTFARYILRHRRSMIWSQKQVLLLLLLLLLLLR